MIEFAFILPILMLTILGAIEFGRYYWIRNTLELAVEEAGRYATISKNATETEIQTKVRNVIKNLLDPKVLKSESISVSVIPTAGSNVTFKTIKATLSTDGGNLKFMTEVLPVKMLRLEVQTRVVVPN